MFCADVVIHKLKGSSEGKYFSFIFPSTCRFFVFALCFNRYKSIR